MNTVIYWIVFRMDEVQSILNKMKNVDIVPVLIEDWNTYCTPWKTDNYEGKANITLERLEDMVKKDSYDIHYLVGYSLAGLFSLWASYNSTVFDGVACCSGSLWYENWMEYAKSHTCITDKIYLSIGRKESKTRNIERSKIVEYMEEQYSLLKDKKVTLVYHNGGHFHEVENRIMEGMKWLLKG